MTTISDDYVDILCSVERATCQICQEITEVLRVCTDEQEDPAFCRRCLIAMRRFLDGELA